MPGGNPFDRNWLEIRILNRLNDRGHAVTLREIRDLVPDMQESITCTVFAMNDEGLVHIFEPPRHDGKLVEITPMGKAVLLEVLSRPKCD